MKLPRLVLLASHGTLGARAAERAAFDLVAPEGRLHHLFVVPDFWKGMLGDDWLNNAAVHVRFGRYVENQLEREIAEYAAEVEAEAKRRNLGYGLEVKLGKPADSLAAVAAGGAYDLVVIGAPRPRDVPGFRSRLVLDVLVKSLKAPLLVVPHPGR